MRVTGGLAGMAVFDALPYMTAVPGGGDAVQVGQQVLTGSGFLEVKPNTPVGVERSLVTKEENGWRKLPASVDAGHVAGGQPFTFGTTRLENSRFDLVYTIDIAPFMEGLLSEKIGQARNPVQEYLQLLSVLVRHQANCETVFPSREAFCFAVAETLARVDQLTNADAEARRAKSGGVEAHLQAYRDAESLLKTAGYQKMPELVLKGWSGEVVFLSSAPGQASSYVEALKWAYQYPRAKDYIDTEFTQVLRKAGIKLEDILQGKVSDDALKASETSQALILGVQHALNEVYRSFWYFNELNEESTGYSQGLLLGATDAGLTTRKHSLETVAVDGPAMADSEPHIADSVPMFSVMGMAPNQLFDICLDTTLYLNFTKGLDVRNTLLDVVRERKILSEEKIAQLTRPLDEKVLKELNERYKGRLVFGAYLPVREMAEDAELREKFAFLELVHAVSLDVMSQGEGQRQGQGEGETDERTPDEQIDERVKDDIQNAGLGDTSDQVFLRSAQYAALRKYGWLFMDPTFDTVYPRLDGQVPASRQPMEGYQPSQVLSGTHDASLAAFRIVSEMRKEQEKKFGGKESIPEGVKVSLFPLAVTAPFHGTTMHAGWVEAVRFIDEHQIGLTEGHGRLYLNSLGVPLDEVRIFDPETGEHRVPTQVEKAKIVIAEQFRNGVYFPGTLRRMVADARRKHPGKPVVFVDKGPSDVHGRGNLANVVGDVATVVTLGVPKGAAGMYGFEQFSSPTRAVDLVSGSMNTQDARPIEPQTGKGSLPRYRDEQGNLRYSGSVGFLNQKQLSDFEDADDVLRRINGVTFVAADGHLHLKNHPVLQRWGLDKVTGLAAMTGPGTPSLVGAVAREGGTAALAAGNFPPFQTRHEPEPWHGHFRGIVETALETTRRFDANDVLDGGAMYVYVGPDKKRYRLSLSNPENRSPGREKVTATADDGSVLAFELRDFSDKFNPGKVPTEGWAKFVQSIVGVAEVDPAQPRMKTFGVNVMHDQFIFNIPMVQAAVCAVDMGFKIGYVTAGLYRKDTEQQMRDSLTPYIPLLARGLSLVPLLPSPDEIKKFETDHVPHLKNLLKDYFSDPAKFTDMLRDNPFFRTERKGSVDYDANDRLAYERALQKMDTKDGLVGSLQSAHKRFVASHPAYFAHEGKGVEDVLEAFYAANPEEFLFISAFEASEGGGHNGLHTGVPGKDHVAKIDEDGGFTHKIATGGLTREIDIADAKLAGQGPKGKDVVSVQIGTAFGMTDSSGWPQEVQHVLYRAASLDPKDRHYVFVNIRSEFGKPINCIANIDGLSEGKVSSFASAMCLLNGEQTLGIKGIFDETKIDAKRLWEIMAAEPMDMTQFRYGQWQQKLQTAFNFFRDRFDDKLELFDEIWKSLRDPSNKALRDKAIERLNAYLNPARLPDEADDAYLKRRQPAVTNVQKYFVEFRTQNAQIPGLNPDWVYVLGGMSIQNLPQHMLRRYFETCRYDAEGRVVEYGERMTVRELVRHLHEGTERYLENLARAAGEAWWRNLAGRETRGLYTVAGLDVEVAKPTEGPDKDRMVMGLDVKAPVDRDQMLDALRKQGTGPLAALLHADSVHSDVSNNLVANRLLGFVRPQPGRRYELVFKNGETEGSVPVLEAIRFYDEVRGDTDKPFLFAEVRVDTHDRVSLQVFNPTHHMDPSQGHPVVGHYRFSLKPRFEGGPLEWNVDVRQYQQDSMAMLYRALLHKEMPDFEGRAVDQAVESEFRFTEETGYAFNTLVAASQRHLLDRRSAKPVALSVFAVAAEALAGAIQVQSHPESGVADATRLLHEGIEIRIGDGLDLTLRNRYKRTPDLQFKAQNRLVGSEMDPKKGGLRKSTLTRVEQNGKLALEILNNTLTLDPEARRPDPALHERLKAGAGTQLNPPAAVHEFPEDKRPVVWEAGKDLFVTRSRIRKYGSVDANVFHHWDLLAESAGQEQGIIAQGMLTAAMMFSQVVEGHFDGSIGDIRSIKVKFEGKALPEDGFRVRLVHKGWAADGHDLYEAQLIPIRGAHTPIVRMEIVARGPERVMVVAGQAFEAPNMFETGAKVFDAPENASPSEIERFKKGQEAYNGFIKEANQFVLDNVGFDLARIVKGNPKLVEFTVKDPLGLSVKDRYGIVHHYKQGETALIEEANGLLDHAVVRQMATVGAELASYVGMRAMGVPEPHRFIVSSLGLTAATAMAGVFGSTPQGMMRALLVALDRSVGIGLVGGQFGLVKGLCFADTQKLCQKFNEEYGQGRNVIWATNENTASTTGIGAVDTETMERFAEYAKQQKSKGTVEVDPKTKFAFHSEAMDPAAELAEKRIRARMAAGQFPEYHPERIVGRVHLDARQGRVAKAGDDPVAEIAYQINHSIHVLPSIKEARKASGARRTQYIDLLAHKVSVSGMVKSFHEKLKDNEKVRVSNLALGDAAARGDILGGAPRSIELRPFEAPPAPKPKEAAAAAAPQSQAAPAPATDAGTGSLGKNFGKYLKDEDAVAGVKATNVGQAILDVSAAFLGRSDVTIDKTFGQLNIDTTKGPQMWSIVQERCGISPKEVDKMTADNMSSLVEAVTKYMGGSAVNLAFVALNPLWARSMPSGHIENLASDDVLQAAVNHIASFGPGVIPLIDQVLATKVRKLKVEFTGDAKKRIEFVEKAMTEVKTRLEAVKEEMQKQQGGQGVDLNDPKLRGLIQDISEETVTQILGRADDAELAVRLADGSIAVPLDIDRKGRAVPRSEAALREAAEELQKIKDNGDPDFLKELTSSTWVPTQLEGWKNVEMNGAIDSLNKLAVTLREAVSAGKYDYAQGRFKDDIFNQWVAWKATHLANQMGEKSMAWLSQMIRQYDVDSDTGARHQATFNPGGLYTPVAQVLMGVYEQAMTEVTEPDGTRKPIFQTRQLLANGVDPLGLTPREVRLLHGLPDPVEIVPSGETIDEFYQKARANGWLSGQLLDEVDRLRRSEVQDLSHVRALIYAGTSTAAKPMIAFLLSKGAKVRMTTTRHFSDVQAEFRELFQEYAVRGAELDVAWKFSFNENSVIQIVNHSLDDGFVPNVFANAGAVEDYLPFNMPTADGKNHPKNHFEAVMNALVKSTTYTLRYIAQRYLELGVGVQVQWLNFHSPAADSPLPGSNTYPFAKSALAGNTVDNIVRTERLHYADGTPVIFSSHLEIGATLPSLRQGGKIMSGQVKNAWEMRNAIRERTGVDTLSFWAEQMGLHLGAMISLAARNRNRGKLTILREHSIGGFDDERVMGKPGDMTSAYPDIAQSVEKKMKEAEEAAAKALKAEYGERKAYALDEVLEIHARSAEKAGDAAQAAAHRRRAKGWKDARQREVMDALNHPFAYGHTQRLVGDNNFFIEDEANKVSTFDGHHHRRNHTDDSDLVVIAVAGTNSAGKNVFDASNAILGKRGLDVAGGVPWRALANTMKGPVKAKDGTDKIVGEILPYDKWSGLTDDEVKAQRRLIVSNIGLRPLANLVANERHEKLEPTEQLVKINADDAALLASFRKENEIALERHKQGGGDEGKFSPPYRFFDVIGKDGSSTTYVSVRKNADLLADVVGRLRVTMFADLPDNFFNNLTGADKEEILFEAMTTVLGRLTTTQLSDMIAANLRDLHMKFGAYLLEFFVARGMVDNAGKNLLVSGSEGDVGTDGGKGVIKGIGNSQGSPAAQQLGIGGIKRNVAAACASGLEAILTAVDKFYSLETQANKGQITKEEFFSTVIYALSMEYGALPSTHVGFDALGPQGAMTRDEFSALHGRTGNTVYAPHDLLRDGFLAGVASSGLVVTTRRMARILGQAPVIEIVGATGTSDFHGNYDNTGKIRAETAPGLTGQALLNWMLHGIIEGAGFSHRNVTQEVSHSTGTDGDPKQATGLRVSERARKVEEQQLAFELALKAVTELGHALGGTMIEPVQAILLFANGIIPGHLSLNNITQEQYNRLSTALSRIHIKFSGHIRPMSVDDVMLVYNFGFHGENRAAAFARPQTVYRSINEALLTQRRIIENRVQQASHFVATHRAFDRPDILPWDAETVNKNRFTTPKLINDNAQVLAEMEVYENLYRHDDKKFDQLFRAVHNRDRKTGERLFTYRYESLTGEIGAYRTFQAKLKSGAIQGFRCITEEDWRTPSEGVVLEADLQKALDALGVSQAWAREYISDRRTFRDEADLTDYYGDLMEGYTAKAPRHFGAIDPLARWNEETERLNFDVALLSDAERQAVGLFLAFKLREAMEGPAKTPLAVSMPSVVSRLTKLFPNAVAAPRSLEDMVVTRFGGLQRKPAATLPRPKAP